MILGLNARRPPLSLRDISPASGEIAILQEIGAIFLVSDLPPRGGDVRQDRGGRSSAKASR
jgi:hypothetical protein